MKKVMRTVGAAMLMSFLSRGAAWAGVTLSVGYEHLPLKELYVKQTERHDGTGTGSNYVSTGSFVTQAERALTIGGIGIRGLVSGEFLLKNLSAGVESGVIIPLDSLKREWSVPAVSTAANTATSGEWDDSGLLSSYLNTSYSQSGKHELKATAVPALVRVGYEIDVVGVRLSIGVSGGGYLVHVRQVATRTRTYVKDSGGWFAGQVDEDVTTYSGVVAVPAYGGSVGVGLGSGKTTVGVLADVALLGKEKALVGTETIDQDRTSAGQDKTAPVRTTRGPEVGGLSWGVRAFVKF